MLMMLVISSLLIFANKKLKIKEDPRLDVIESLLPNANCGACGYAGCRQFAEALIAKQTQPGLCSVSDDAGRQRIGHIIGVEVVNIEKTVARIACAGGDNVAKWAGHYQGVKNCNIAATVAGGGKACAWGCLGFGDCEQICDFNAIDMNQHGLPVVNEELCTACGDCVTICPKELFSLHKISHRLWVNCKNLQKGDEILAACEVACTACGRCAMDAREDLIIMDNNLPIVDYSKTHETKEPLQRCPTGAIVWINDSGTIEKGVESKKIIRQTALM